MKKIVCMLLVMMIAGLTAAQAEFDANERATAAANDALYVIVDGERYASNRYTMYVPVDYAVELPSVVDYTGIRLAVTWKMKETSKYFTLYSNGKIKSSMQMKSCELIATDTAGRTFELNVESYVLAKKIYSDPSTLTINVGDYKRFSVRPNNSGSLSGQVGDLTWTVEDDTVVSFEKASYNTGMNIVTGLKPGTTTVTATQINGAKATCTITVVDPNYLPGDADENRVVDAYDTLRILQQEAGWSVSLNTAYADVNKDGSVNMEDALLILRYVAGENVTLE